MDTWDISVHFLQLNIYLQLPQNKMFNLKRAHQRLRENILKIYI